MTVDTAGAGHIKGWLETKAAKKLALWLVLSLALSLIFFRDFWTGLPAMLSPAWVFGPGDAYPWGVLGLCLIVVWLKKKDVWRAMGRRASPLFIVAGLALIAGALLMPASQYWLVFQVLVASLGVFVVLFGSGAKVPSILLAVYGFALSFPLAIERFAGNAYSRTAIAPLTGLLTVAGYPFQYAGQWVHFTSSTNESISVAITAACAGPATMGVFIALFALMMLDMPVPPRTAAWLFVFGALGTWFQSLVRLAFVILVGYYLGENALRTAHFWTIYILFPLWYLLFGYIYFRQVRRPPQARTKQAGKQRVFNHA